MARDADWGARMRLIPAAQMKRVDLRFKQSPSTSGRFWLVGADGTLGLQASLASLLLSPNGLTGVVQRGCSSLLVQP